MQQRQRHTYMYIGFILLYYKAHWAIVIISICICVHVCFHQCWPCSQHRHAHTHIHIQAEQCTSIPNSTDPLNVFTLAPRNLIWYMWPLPGISTPRTEFREKKLKSVTRTLFESICYKQQPQFETIVVVVVIVCRAFKLVRYNLILATCFVTFVHILTLATSPTSPGVYQLHPHA